MARNKFRFYVMIIFKKKITKISRKQECENIKRISHSNRFGIIGMYKDAMMIVKQNPKLKICLLPSFPICQ